MMKKKISFAERFASVGMFPPLLVISVVVLVTIMFVTAVGPFFLPDPYEQDLASRLLPPFSEGHLLGTDALGRDLLSRIVNGGRVSLPVALLGMFGSIVVGIIAGLLASSSHRFVRWLVERLIDVQMALPYVILAIVVVSAVGTSIAVLIILMVLAGWASAARVVRSVGLVERAKDYVSAAEMIGASGARVTFRYIGPTVIPVVLTLAPLHAAAMIVMESTLSFLGLGIQPPTASWGGVLLEGKSYITDGWWLTTLPGLVIALTCAAMIALGSSVDSYLLERQRRRVVDVESTAGVATEKTENLKNEINEGGARL